MKSWLQIFSFVVALLSLMIYNLFSSYFPTIPCHEDPPITFEYTTATTTTTTQRTLTWNACEIYSLSYYEARSKFRTIVERTQQMNDRVELISLPLPIIEDDDDGGDYTIDIAIYPGNQDLGSILHTSGTHGIEGYAGSAIQLAMIDTLLKDDDAVLRIENRPTLIFVHAVNPYGMAKYRRFNEHNVDLNRNCIYPNFEKFVQSRDPNIAGYEDFRQFVSPTTPTFWSTGIPLLFKYGYEKLKSVLVAGQYHHPEGLFYGGGPTKYEPSIEILLGFLESRDSLWNELVAHVDVHTGLGKSGKDTLMFEDDEKYHSHSLEDQEQQKKAFPTAYSIITPNSKDKAAMSGYDLTRGMFTGLVQYKATHSRCLAMTQEFGTIPGILVGRALILENAITQHGDGTQKERGRQLLQQAFYPQSTEWRSLVVQRGVALIYELVEYTTSQNRLK